MRRYFTPMKWNVQGYIWHEAVYQVTENAFKMGIDQAIKSTVVTVPSQSSELPQIKNSVWTISEVIDLYNADTDLDNLDDLDQAFKEDVTLAYIRQLETELDSKERQLQRFIELAKEVD